MLRGGCRFRWGGFRRFTDLLRHSVCEFAESAFCGGGGVKRPVLGRVTSLHHRSRAELANDNSLPPELSRSSCGRLAKEVRAFRFVMFVDVVTHQAGKRGVPLPPFFRAERALGQGLRRCCIPMSLRGSFAALRGCGLWGVCVACGGNFLPDSLL